jgi:type III restriction enzyme
MSDKAMDKKIKFLFEDNLAHQMDAITSTVALFDELPKKLHGLYAGKSSLASGESRNPHITMGTRMLENLRNLQLGNRLFSDEKLYNGNFGIEMETGTGKTYVYLRTILDLYKTYGIKKFMIVVPSIAIRKGVETSVTMLKDHLKAIYNLDITKHCFVYESGTTRMTGFIERRDLDICIINMQAFAADRTRIQNADEYGHVIWEELKEIKPVVILDEPQRIEGTRRQPSKSIQAINELKPLFILKYSATHKEEFPFNMIYKLDSFEAFQQDLVKRIRVKTVYGVIPKNFHFVRYLGMTKDLKARIEIFHRQQGDKIRLKKLSVLGGDSLFDLSGQLVQYSNMRIAENPHKLKPLKISTSTGFFELNQDTSNKDVTQEEAVRIQIRLAIENHLDKQFDILDAEMDVKALTLFFIDAVKMVRDDSQEDNRGQYLRIFDEIYQELIHTKKYRKKFEQYASLFSGYTDTANVREGYFARDKHNSAQEVIYKANPKPGDEFLKKSQEDIDRGISLILDKKDELISFTTPLAFIFSHSALREGWDNPNIFTLCTLKVSASEIAKKQEIGRGLRLPVDIHGKRIKDEKINELTVIANDHYDHFAETLQSDFNESMAFNKDEVTAQILANSLIQAGIPAEKITPELVDDFKKELYTHNIINDKNMLTKAAEKIETIAFVNDTLKEHAINIRSAFVELMHQRGTHKIPIKNGDDPPPENREWGYVTEDEFKKILNHLKQHLMKRALYRFDLDQKVFIQDCTTALNDDLRHKSNTYEYEIITGAGGFDKAQKFELTPETNQVVEVMSGWPNGSSQRSLLEIVDDIMYHTMLPRLAIMKIIRGLEKPGMLQKQDILELVIQKISRLLKDQKARNIKAYEVINGYCLDSTRIFEADIVDEDLLQKSKKYYKTREKQRKALHQYYRMDSDGEYEFAQHLEENDNVFLFTKLKKGGFVIDTPYGHYSPDWAIVYRHPENKLKLYFIVETKADKAASGLTGMEIAKINCGNLHFKAVSDDIQFDWVNSYSDFKNKFGVMDDYQ